jgi:hypothetical protein
MNLLRYQRTIDTALAHEGPIVIDNVFPVLRASAFEYKFRNGLVDVANKGTEACHYLKKKIDCRQILVIKEVYEQARSSRVLIKQSIKKTARKAPLNAAQARSCRTYEAAFKEVWRSAIRQQYEPTNLIFYQAVLAALRGEDQKSQLRKKNHKKDGFVDGKVVAAAYSELLDHSEIAIITDDKDLGKLCSAITNMQLRETKLVLYTGIINTPQEIQIFRG